MKWISIEERLPQEKERVLVLEKEEHGDPFFISIANRDEDEFWLDDGPALELDKITHWMPLPEPPNEK
jgi:hypothetical protein